MNAFEAVKDSITTRQAAEDPTRSCQGAVSVAGPCA